MRFDGFALFKEFVNGLLSEWLTAQKKMKVETINKALSSDKQTVFQPWPFFGKNFSRGRVQGTRDSSSYLGCAHMSPWRIFSLTLMGAFTRIFKLTSQCVQGTQRPIHTRECFYSWVLSILPVEFANCSASSISETHWWK